MASVHLSASATTRLPPNVFARVGYDFAGWNTVADGSGTGYAEKASLTMGGSNLTLYAQWTPETVAFASANTISSSADNAKLIHTVDIDGDGDMDVLSASYGDDTIAWYENNGSESFTERTIDSGANGAWSVSGVDVDGDGDVDVLAASYDDDTVAWYENNGSESFTKRTVTTAVNGPHVAYATDVDGDGDVDILSASNEDDTIAGSRTMAPGASPSVLSQPRMAQWRSMHWM